MSKHKTDWQGKPVPDDEPDDKVIQVWEITPHPDGFHSHAVIRSWQDVNEFMCRVPEMYLDGSDETECREGVTVRIRLRNMTVYDYGEIEHAD